MFHFFTVSIVFLLHVPVKRSTLEILNDLFFLISHCMLALRQLSREIMSVCA